MAKNVLIKQFIFLLTTLIIAVNGYGVSSWEDEGSTSNSVGGVSAVVASWQGGSDASGLRGFSAWSPVKQEPVVTEPTLNMEIDRVLVNKSQKKLYLISGNQVFKEYKIVLGKNPVGHKQEEGDGRTPEGTYTLDWRNPESKFYRSIHISYPNEQDLAQAQAKKRNPGKHIMIHGSPAWVPSVEWAKQWLQKDDWTDGCIAVTNDVMDELWQLVKYGTPIEIKP